MNESSATGLPDVFAPDEVALFLDFDGTLVDFADQPEAVVLDTQTRDCIEILYERLDGALAIITGRDIASVDQVLSPYRLPAAGVHGLLRRDASGRVHELRGYEDTVGRLAEELKQFATRHKGLLIEPKPGAVALHYRRRPDLADACAAEMERLTADLSAVTLLRGKFVIEARANGADKGSAIMTFLKEPPFAGRRPIFAGDDVTDEDGFAQVNALDGITIKVGGGHSCARYRAPTIADFRDWLCRTAYQFERGEEA